MRDAQIFVQASGEAHSMPCACQSLPIVMHACLQGYGTVRLGSEEEVARAIEEFNGYELEGRNLTVKVDQFA